MSRVIGVDPGLRACGVALYNANSLEWARLVAGSPVKTLKRHELWWVMSDAVMENAELTRGDTLVVEVMKVYAGSKAKGDPQDLLDVQGVSAAITTRAIMRGARVETVFGYEWKHQLDKDMVTRRVMDRLSLDEQSRIKSAGAKTHNVIEAVGIGLFHLDRFDQKRVIAR